MESTCALPWPNILAWSRTRFASSTTLRPSYGAKWVREPRVGCLAQSASLWGPVLDLVSLSTVRWLRKAQVFLRVGRSGIFLTMAGPSKIGCPREPFRPATTQGPALNGRSAQSPLQPLLTPLLPKFSVNLAFTSEKHCAQFFQLSLRRLSSWAAVSHGRRNSSCRPRTKDSRIRNSSYGLPPWETRLPSWEPELRGSAQNPSGSSDRRRRSLDGLLGRRSGRKRIDHFTRLGIMELLARFVLDSVRIRLQSCDPIPQMRVLLLQLIDFFAQLAVFNAFLLPHRQTVLAVDNVPGKQQRQSHDDGRARRAPHAYCPFQRPCGQRHSRHDCSAWYRIFL